MPSEVEKIVLPYHEQNAELFEWVDKKMRNKDGIDSILAHTNEVILKEGYKLSDTEIKMANDIWKKLSNRRLNRN